jgi:hypothetical protein
MAVMKRSIIWVAMPCNPLKANRHFGGTCRLHHQDRNKNQETLMNLVAGRVHLYPVREIVYFSHYLTSAALIQANASLDMYFQRTLFCHIYTDVHFMKATVECNFN